MILFTLDIKKIKEQGTIYIIVTLVCILFAMIYESFSHGVISNFMVYAFTIPLIFGVGVYYMFYFFKIKKLPNKFENRNNNSKKKYKKNNLIHNYESDKHEKKSSAFTLFTPSNEGKDLKLRGSVAIVLAPFSKSF